MIAMLYLVLGLTTGICCLWLTPRRSRLTIEGRAAVHAALLGLILPTLALLLMSFTSALSSHAINPVQHMLGHAAQHMSLPLLGLAALQLTRDQPWQPIAWGRLVIGLMLGFEVSRRLGWQEQWLWLINLAGLGALGLAALRHLADKRLMVCWVLSSAGLLAPFSSGGLPLIALTEANVSAAALLLLYSGATTMIGLLINRRTQDVGKVADPTQSRAVKP